MASQKSAVDSQTPGAGPSTANIDPALFAPVLASARPLPPASFYSVEYAGYVRPTSIPVAVERLGGQKKLEIALRRPGNKAESALELHLRPENPFAHPIPGEVVATSNLLLKVVKRKRRKKDGEISHDGIVGDYTAEVVGTIPRTGRFRSMADFQYQPDINDSITKLRSSLDKMDVEDILKFRMPEEKEDYVVPSDPNSMDIDPKLLRTDGDTQAELAPPEFKSNMRLPPPPVFSRQAVPQNYNFKANTASIVSTIVDEETGEEKKRLINNMRWKGYGPIAIPYTAKEVPDKPSKQVEDQKHHADKKLLSRLQELFNERPIWTRAAILNQFEPWEVKEIHNSKILLPLVSYVFQDGPWRDTHIRLGYDPRKLPEARFFQRLYFRNINHPMARPSVADRRQDGRNEVANARAAEKSRQDRRSHIFDGQHVTKETAAFQLCDIQDEMLQEMIEDEEEVRETCHERDGWYTSHALERIKLVLRHKFFSLLSGFVATREECEALLVPHEGTDKLPNRPTYRARPGKHNMAKGALRPEDAAAQRLKATLDQRVKNFSSQQRGG
ncbi:hypothetical protein K474DRAFT_1705387 [Panus rudis PR-1116 ss-1]|nr:hypothetical protein K474DRAFT_1705387 [Panus rudis PR-1116 ss-1]